jgi:outer membrane protein assembly factor BamB
MKQILIGVLALTACTAQADWPQYLGPDRNAVAPDTELARTWPKGGPKRIWAVSMGEGFGGASIHGGEVFLLDRIKSEADVLRCLDFATGDEKWRFRYEAPGKFSYPGSRTVPTVDNEHIWTVGAFGHLYCFSRKTQEPVWFTNMLEDFDGEPPGWGVSQAPLIFEDLVIVAPQGEKAGLAAYDKKTGELRWTSRKLTGPPGHASPALGNYGGAPQVIMISPYDREDPSLTNEVLSVDAKTGEELWSYDGLHSFATITPPMPIDDRRLFLSDRSYNGEYQPVSIMLDIQRVDGRFTVSELFKTEVAGSKIHPAVLHNGYLYLNSGRRGDMMRCISLDGENVWTEAPDFHLGALLLAGDLIISQSGKAGEIYLIEATPKGYKELAMASPFSGKGTPWAPLAMSDGKLLVRDSETLICLDLRNPG